MGGAAVRNARLQFEGGDRFRLLGYESVPPAASVPPLDSLTSLRSWLASGEYKSWHCEAAVHPPAQNSGHGNVRICSNPLLSASSTTPFPVGAASVKELYSGNTVVGYAVGVKIAEGTGAHTWHWYEGVGGTVIANGVGVGICESCHAGAATDRVFVRLR